MKENVKIAAISVESQPGNTEANLQEIRRWAQRAAQQGVALALFPELSVTGFLPNHPVGDHAQWLQQALKGAWETAEGLDGNAIRELAKISLDTGVFIAAGLLENAGNVLHNTHVLVGEGRLYGRWRKMHIPMFEMPIYNGGDAPEVVDTPLGRIGVNICFDTLLPESTRLLGVQNCEIGLFPFAADPAPGTAKAWADWCGSVLKARCSENGLFGISCNYVGNVSYAGADQKFPGGSMVIGPDGSVIAEGESQMLTVELSAQTLINARSAFEYTFRFRRPELYGSLAQSE